ncbi:unnamed protein product [Trichogramma brassicae]|uniref:Uncharacterized protein n=1 Tax=Trichogramma brassicae TaxID=86971 RepID=A0A6H5IMQ9_9HYME|nr:unnamed protein product [Trichogramma brassicae]
MAEEPQNEDPQTRELKRLVRRRVDLQSEGIASYLDPIYALITNWTGARPSLLEPEFQKEEIDSLLEKFVSYFDYIGDKAKDVIEFVKLAGFRDRPDIPEDGELSSRRVRPSPSRVTPIHYLARAGRFYLEPVYRQRIDELFHIYNGFDVNHIDEYDGCTHFHAACMSGNRRVVEKFLAHGQNPNVLWCLDTPLHLAAKHKSEQNVVRLLLKHGANPNQPDAEGSTPLHVFAKIGYGVYLMLIFRHSRAEHRPVQVDARDRRGRAPLHLALGYNKKNVVDALLKRGRPSLNSADADGLTPLHHVCQRAWRHDMVEILSSLFGAGREQKNWLRVNRRDRSGRTPLQLAVAGLCPDAVDALLTRNVDLASFVFPIEAFCERLNADHYYLWYKMKMLTSALAVVDCLRQCRYELSLDDALAIMQFFNKSGLWQKSRKFAYDEYAVSVAKACKLDADMSLHDFIELPLREAAMYLYKQTSLNYNAFVQFQENRRISREAKQAFVEHVCEVFSRRFFQREARYPLWKLVRHRLPLLCCDLTVKNDALANKDLYHICLAARGLGDRTENSTTGVVRYNPRPARLEALCMYGPLSRRQNNDRRSLVHDNWRGLLPIRDEVERHELQSSLKNIMKVVNSSAEAIFVMEEMLVVLFEGKFSKKNTQKAVGALGVCLGAASARNKIGILSANIT